ncbi:MAG: hypothetical protein QOD98_2012 [Nocardioidaceae bacterium]|nr:hypothetical protein [Nocardioidaceae bacterium]
MRRLRLVVGTLALLLLASLAPAAISAPGAGADRRARTGSFLGIDGLTYPSAPIVVDTASGLFFGPDFDLACAYGGRAVPPMKAMTKLARLVERSGRRVIWSGAPSKTSVLFDHLAPGELPHGSCDEVGQRAQSRTTDTYRDPNYLPIRKPLSESTRQVYWRTDPHWTTVGGAIWARAIGAKLDPKLGDRQRYTYGTETQVGLFNSLRGIDTPETLETAMPAGHVHTRTSRSSVMQWAGYPNGVSDYSWDSRPANRTWPGHTLVFGDSFSFYALPNLLPLFRHGRFMWIGTVDVHDVVRAIRHSDTVVFEVYQTFLPLGTVLTTKEFRQQVRAALRGRS